MAAGDVAQAEPRVPNDGNVGQPPPGLIRYTVVSSVIVLLAFCSLLWALSGHGVAGEEPAGGAGAYSAGVHTLLMIATTFVSGALGGCLYSLRGLIKHSARNDFNVYYNYWYLLSPLSGGISGIVVFFLLLGGALTLNISTGSGSQGLRSIEGLALAPYIAFALLAGYASRTFMLKMKDVADSLFSLKNDE
jgi:hypothetical protein